MPCENAEAAVDEKEDGSGPKLDEELDHLLAIELRTRRSAPGILSGSDTVSAFNVRRIGQTIFLHDPRQDPSIDPGHRQDDRDLEQDPDVHAIHLMAEERRTCGFLERSVERIRWR